MRLMFFRLVAAALAFTVGIACVWFVGLYPRLEDKFTDVVAGIWNFEKFQAVSFSCGPASSTTEYVTLFGARVRRSYVHYPSPSLASQDWEERVKHASRIIERKPVLVDGKVVGERMVAMFGSRAAILWTKGDTIYTIDAPSLGLAVGMERSEGRE